VDAVNGETYSISAVRFAVYGEGRWEPAPQGSKTPNRNGGVRESSKYLKPWRKKVIEASAKVLAEQCEGIPFDGPLAVDLVFRMHRGKTVRRTHHTTTPDGDKLMRAVFDGLTQGGLITDDSIVVKGTYEKGYATPKSGQGVLITIHKVIT
jgi:Holliday junction resolvase RusA-like endonuclease